jgi:hypothetical protein
LTGASDKTTSIVDYKADVFMKTADGKVGKYFSGEYKIGVEKTPGMTLGLEQKAFTDFAVDGRYSPRDYSTLPGGRGVSLKGQLGQRYQSSVLSTGKGFAPYNEVKLTGLSETLLTSKPTANAEYVTRYGRGTYGVSGEPSLKTGSIEYVTTQRITPDQAQGYRTFERSGTSSNRMKPLYSVTETIQTPKMDKSLGGEIVTKSLESFSRQSTAQDTRGIRYVLQPTQTQSRGTLMLTSRLNMGRVGELETNKMMADVQSPQKMFSSTYTTQKTNRLDTLQRTRTLPSSISRKGLVNLVTQSQLTRQTQPQMYKQTTPQIIKQTTPQKMTFTSPYINTPPTYRLGPPIRGPTYTNPPYSRAGFLPIGGRGQLSGKPYRGLGSRWTKAFIPEAGKFFGSPVSKKRNKRRKR